MKKYENDTVGLPSSKKRHNRVKCKETNAFSGASRTVLPSPQIIQQEDTTNNFEDSHLKDVDVSIKGLLGSGISFVMTFSIVFMLMASLVQCVFMLSWAPVPINSSS
jgi:hypothetical protein